MFCIQKKYHLVLSPIAYQVFKGQELKSNGALWYGKRLFNSAGCPCALEIRYAIILWKVSPLMCPQLNYTEPHMYMYIYLCGLDSKYDIVLCKACQLSKVVMCNGEGFGWSGSLCMWTFTIFILVKLVLDN